MCSVVAVDKSKFRTCKHGGFCKRYLKYVKKVKRTGDFAHILDPDSVVQDGHVVRATLAHVHGAHASNDERSPSAGDTVVEEVQPLSLEIGLFKDAVVGHCGVIRILIADGGGTPLHHRFRPRPGDVVVEEDLIPDEASTGTTLEGTTSIFAAAPGNCSVLLRHRPFELEIFGGGRLLQSLNGQHLLNFEQYRARNAAPRLGLVDATDVDASNLWEEKFREHVDSKQRGPAAVGVDVGFIRAPVVVGLAEHAAKLHLAAHNFSEPYRLFNLDVFEYEVDTPMALYGNIPMVTAVHHWPEQDAPPTASGFLIVNPSEGFVKVDGPPTRKPVGSGGGTSTWWLFESGVLDMFSFVGPSPETVLQQYHSVTGWPRLPPSFTFGKHQSRWNYIDVEDVLAVDKGFDSHRIPYDVLWLDLEHTEGKRYFTWDKKHFSDPGRMLDALAGNHRKVVTIVDPHLKGDATYTPFSRMNKSDFLVRASNGSTYEGFCWPGKSFYPDFCNPAARDEWANLFSPEVYPHSRPDLYTWNDMNEPSVFNGPEISMPRDNLHKCHAEKYSIEHRDVHNLYGFYVHAATVQGQLQRAPDLRPFVLTRAFFAGTHRHGPVWTGDNTANWMHLVRSTSMLVTLAMCGLSVAGADVAGFIGDPKTDLFVKWHQLGIWYPFYRGHAHLTTKRREPWLFGDSITKRVRGAVFARYQLLPMWYTLAAEWAWRGLPLIRPIWYNDLGDVQAYDYADEHFFVGDALLVRGPKPGNTKLDVYLPLGEWFDYWDERAAARHGGSAFQIDPHPDHVPVFARSGHILMKKMRPRRSTGAMVGDPYTLVAYGAPARGRIYIDDGASHDFKAGAYIYDELEFDGKALRARAAELPATAPQSMRNQLAVPTAGLRIERVVLLGLPKKPTAVRCNKCGELVDASGARDLRFTAALVAEGTTWTVTVKDPAVHLGGQYDWALEVLY